MISCNLFKLNRHNIIVILSAASLSFCIPSYMDPFLQTLFADVIEAKRALERSEQFHLFAYQTPEVCTFTAFFLFSAEQSLRADTLTLTRVEQPRRESSLILLCKTILSQVLPPCGECPSPTSHAKPQEK